MKKLCFPVWFCLAAVLFSCAAAPAVKKDHPVSEAPPEMKNPTEASPSKAAPSEAAPLEAMPAAIAPAGTTAAEASFAGMPERPVKPAIPQYIMGKGFVKPKDMADFLLSVNPGAEKDFVDNLAFIYTEETAEEGVNHDAAFAQMCLETGFLRFGGLVTPDMNNFCGLGSIGPGQEGLSFPDPRTGIRAHIQHLKAYATDAPLKKELVDPRYRYVRLGSSPAIKGLSGTWAADRSYGDKIKTILERLYSFTYGNS